MRHPWLRRLTLPLWAVWLALAVTERPLTFDCPMHSPAAMGGGTMAGMSGMAHESRPGHDAPVDARCCGCLGDCSAAAAVVLPASGHVVAIQFATPVCCVTEPAADPAPVSRVDLSLPFPNGPPLSALI
jgi:hypothetical protein